MTRRPWWMVIDRPRDAWSLLPSLLLVGTSMGAALSRGNTPAAVLLIAVAVAAAGLVLAALLHFRRHPEHVGHERRAPTLPRGRRVAVAVAVTLGMICAVTGLIVLAIGNGGLGAVLFVLGLLPVLIGGTVLGDAAER